SSESADPLESSAPGSQKGHPDQPLACGAALARVDQPGEPGKMCSALEAVAVVCLENARAGLSASVATPGRRELRGRGGRRPLSPDCLDPPATASGSAPGSY